MTEIHKKKFLRSTAAQIKVLVDYMSTNTNFAAGDFNGPLGAKKLEAEWQTLKLLLAEHGPDKSVEQWKQTWKDLKKKARHENAAAARAQSQTGNFVVVPVVSETMEKVLDTIGRESSVGIGPPETSIGTFGVPTNVNTECEYLASTSAAAHDLSQATASHPRPRPRPRQHPSMSHKQMHASATEFADLQNENNTILKKVVELMEEKNNLLREQNSILRESNRIMKRNFHRK